MNSGQGDLLAIPLDLTNCLEDLCPFPIHIQNKEKEFLTRGYLDVKFKYLNQMFLTELHSLRDIFNGEKGNAI